MLLYWCMRVKKALLIVSMFVGCVALVHSANGLTYQTEVDVEFNFNAQLSMTITGADDGIVIVDLPPGTARKSNTATINVTTNNVTGYTLTATLGDGATYTNNNLTNTDANATFESLTTGTQHTLSSMGSLNCNCWGHAIGTITDSTTTYKRLNYGDNTINVTVDASGTPKGVYTGTNQTKFTIAAKALSTQPTGTYRNVVTFTALANVIPQTLEQSYATAGKTKYNGFYKMQDMTTAICSATEAVDGLSQMRAIDIRDGKIYWITKLQDGHCWMTQNLDLDLDNSVTYTHADTDLGWGSDSATTTWTPTNSTIQLNSDGQTFSFISSSSAPQSLNVDDWYYAGYNGSLLAGMTVNYLTSSNRTNTNGLIDVNDGNGINYFSNGPFDNNGMHGHIGNYYNWPAAIATNNASNYTSSTYGNVNNNPQNSICPAGWRLPTITSASPTYTSAGSRNEFARLVYLYNGNNLVTDSSAKLEDAPLFFVRGSSISNNIMDPGLDGVCWSSTVSGSSGAYYLSFEESAVGVNYYSGREFGMSVRCVAR